MEMSIPYFKPENREEIWRDISKFRTEHPQGKLAVITLKDFNWYYNKWGPDQTDKALEAVIGVFRQAAGMEWFAYRNYGRWLVGFYQEGTKERIQEGVGQLSIDTQGKDPATEEIKLPGKVVKVNPAKVKTEIEYVEVNSIDGLFKE
jgi:hypothetical protein